MKPVEDKLSRLEQLFQISSEESDKSEGQSLTESHGQGVTGLSNYRQKLRLFCWAAIIQFHEGFRRSRNATTSSLGRDSPPETTGLGLMPSFEFEPSKLRDDARVNGIHQDEITSRCRDDIGAQSHIRQVTA